MAGLKLSWLPVDWGITKNKDQLINKQKEINQIRLDDFKHQLSISIIKDNNDIEKFKRMLERDRELAAIQGRIVTTAYSQLNHGVITSTEYITELNKATQINIDTKIHELQLIQSKINLLIRSGNYNQ